jgi:NitT/TauT family transport system permease protein
VVFIIKNLKNYSGTILIVLGAVLFYELATDVNQWLEPVLFPGLSKIIPLFFASLPKLFEGLKSSLGLLIPGFLGAASLGIILGLLIGLNPKVHKNLKPIIYALNPIPPTLFTPYAITLLPTFWHSSVFIIFVGCFWPILNGTINGIVLIDQKYLDNAKLFFRPLRP